MFKRSTVRARGLALAGLAVCATTGGAVTASQTQAADAATPEAKPPVAQAATVKAKSARHVRAGRSARVRGKVAPAKAGRKVALQVRTRKGWKTVKRGVTRKGGVFRMKWKTPRAGRYRLRVKFRGDTTATRGRGQVVARERLPRRPRLVVRPRAVRQQAGLWRHADHRHVGVAHKSLPCGTKVTFRYGRRSVAARVIDRGPYVGGREWDLTAALKQKLGFPSTGTVLTTR